MSERPRVLALGELLIDFVAEERGVTLAGARSFLKAPGGAPANVAVGVARLGVASGFVGRVGDDAFGRYLADVLAREGVDVSSLRFDTTARTALAFVSRTADGERDFTFFRHPSADMLHDPSDLDERAIAEARVLHVGSISLIAKRSAETTRRAVAVARGSGGLVSYDPNLRLPLWPSGAAAKAGIRSLWRDAHVIKISDEELTFLTGRDDEAAARSLWHDELKLLLVTRGVEGVRYLLPDASGEVAGFAVDTLDTTGAGDSFTAAVLAALVEDDALLTDRGRLERALRRANAFAALTTTEPGAIPAMPSRERLDAFLSDAGAA